jgi:acyl dehydratase
MILPQTLIERRFLVDREAIRRYADVTLDYNPIHLDPGFAAATPFGGIIAHGMLSLSLIWQSLAATFGPKWAAGMSLDIRFVHPVRENQWVAAGGMLSDVNGTYDVWVNAESKDGSTRVITGTAKIDTSAKAGD